MDETPPKGDTSGTAPRRATKGRTPRKIGSPSSGPTQPGPAIDGVPLGALRSSEVLLRAGQSAAKMAGIAGNPATLAALRQAQSRAAAVGAGPLPETVRNVAGSMGSLTGTALKDALASLGTMPTVAEALASRQRLDSIAERLSGPVTPSAEVVVMQGIRKEIAAQATIAGETAVNMAGLRTLMEAWLTAQERSEKARSRSDKILLGLTAALVVCTVMLVILTAALILRAPAG